MNTNPLGVGAIALVVVVAAIGVPATATSATTQQDGAYSGTYVSFDTTADAVTGYSVGGQTMVESVTVQSTSDAGSDGGIGVGSELSAVTNFTGAPVSVATTTETRATVTTDSGAELRAHDTDRGILVVTSESGSQYVRANLSSSSEAEQADEDRVVVTNADGSQGTFIATGDGQVTVNDRGNVTARVSENGRLVYRQYEGERSESEEEQERMIADGTAAAEVYVQQSSEDGQETTADVAHYSEDTTVEITERSSDRVNMTVERSQSEGKVVITSISEEAFSSTEDVNVTVDGEAAAEASSYGEVRQATQGGDQSKYLVRQSSGAQASSDVVVGVNHFSSRDVSVASAGDGGSSIGAPGFGIGVALLALLAAVLLARIRE